MNPVLIREGIHMAKIDTIIRGARVVLRNSVEELDIGIAGEKIIALSPQLVGDEDTEMIEAAGLTVMPGAVDIHVHFNEPGLASWEGFKSGSASLAAGGITTYVDMPLNGVPPTIRPDAWEMKMKAADGQSYVDYAFWGGLVPVIGPSLLLWPIWERLDSRHLCPNPAEQGKTSSPEPMRTHS
jgi:allantoinase